MDRLVMGDPVPEEVEALHAIRHVAPNPSRVTCRWVSRKRGGKGGHHSDVNYGGSHRYRQNPKPSPAMTLPCTALPQRGGQLLVHPARAGVTTIEGYVVASLQRTRRRDRSC